MEVLVICFCWSHPQIFWPFYNGRHIFVWLVYWLQFVNITSTSDLRDMWRGGGKVEWHCCQKLEGRTAGVVMVTLVVVDGNSEGQEIVGLGFGCLSCSLGQVALRPPCHGLSFSSYIPSFTLLCSHLVTFLLPLLWSSPASSTNSGAVVPRRCWAHSIFF